MKKIITCLILTVVMVSGCGLAGASSDSSELKTDEKTTVKSTNLKDNLQLQVKKNIKNPNYKVYISENDIQRDLSKLGGIYQKYYTKFIQYIAPNGKPITIVAQDKVTDEQMIYAYNQLSFYLEDYGTYKKDKVANNIANSGAVLVMPNGADGESKIPNEALRGQPLYQMEVPVVGSKWYIDNDYEHRDAAFEEIFHMVHDYGIGIKSSHGALPELQKKIYAATMNSLPKDKNKWGKEGIWGIGSRDWLFELEQEGSLEQEYLASVLDSYYGLWEPYTEGSGGMWGVYTSKSREEIKKNDPMGYKIINEFLPSNITYMARVDSGFTGTFKMYYDKEQPYTHKSKYLVNARLLGTKDSGLIGNSEDNILMGNMGNNHIDGKDGRDVVQFNGASSDYKITYDDETTVVIDTLGRDGKDTLINIEVLRFTDKDVVVNKNK